jgi:hypothetical protein
LFGIVRLQDTLSRPLINAAIEFNHKINKRGLGLRKQDNEVSEWLDEVAIETIDDVFRHVTILSGRAFHIAGARLKLPAQFLSRGTRATCTAVPGAVPARRWNAYLVEPGCDLDHVLHPEQMIAW